MNLNTNNYKSSDEIINKLKKKKKKTLNEKYKAKNEIINKLKKKTLNET